MSEVRLGVIMNGVTGRMGTNQHLVRSILAIQRQGVVALASGDRVMPDPILVGRNAEKLQALATTCGVERWTTNLDEALSNEEDRLFFDSASTKLRAELLKKAMDAGKDIYCEKPIAENLDAAIDMVRHAALTGCKNGVVHDKLSLPGIMKLENLVGKVGRSFLLQFCLQVRAKPAVHQPNFQRLCVGVGDLSREAKGIGSCFARHNPLGATPGFTTGG